MISLPNYYTYVVIGNLNLSDSLKFKNTAFALVAVLVLEVLFIFNSVYATNNMPGQTITPHIASQNHSNGHVGRDV